MSPDPKKLLEELKATTRPVIELALRNGVKHYSSKGELLTDVDVILEALCTPDGIIVGRDRIRGGFDA